MFFSAAAPAASSIERNTNNKAQSFTIFFRDKKEMRKRIAHHFTILFAVSLYSFVVRKRREHFNNGFFFS
jgi:hypothetical protein